MNIENVSVHFGTNYLGLRTWHFGLQKMSYILNTPAQQAEMLKTIGVKSIDELFEPIPAQCRLQRPLAVPAAVSEMELTQEMQRLAAANISPDQAVCFLGGGSYDHFIPAVVDQI